MTPAEKAKELVDKYKEFTQFRNDGGHDEEVTNDNAKQCALIAVQELIKYLPSSDGNPPNLPETIYNSEFWEKVKEEINKL